LAARYDELECTLGDVYTWPLHAFFSDWKSDLSKQFYSNLLLDINLHYADLMKFMSPKATDMSYI